MSLTEAQVFRRVAVGTGILERWQAEACIATQRLLPERRRLAVIAVRRRFVSVRQMRTILDLEGRLAGLGPGGIVPGPGEAVAQPAAVSVAELRARFDRPPRPVPAEGPARKAATRPVPAQRVGPAALRPAESRWEGLDEFAPAAGRLTALVVTAEDLAWAGISPRAVMRARIAAAAEAVAPVPARAPRPGPKAAPAPTPAPAPSPRSVPAPAPARERAQVSSPRPLPASPLPPRRLPSPSHLSKPAHGTQVPAHPPQHLAPASAPHPDPLPCGERGPIPGRRRNDPCLPMQGIASHTLAAAAGALARFRALVAKARSFLPKAFR